MTLIEIAQKIAAPGKGILAADESTGTIEKRFQGIHLACTEENRRAYRDLLFSTPEVENYLSGVILYEETLTQKDSKGVPFSQLLAKKGIIPGIKVDKGLVNLPFTDKEKITQGLDGLAERLTQYKEQGAQFAKWRAVFNITDDKPSNVAIKTNAHALARYAAICQEAGIVPIVEPEILMDGNHSLERCKIVTEKVLHAVFNQLIKQKVILEGMILKPSMVTAGQDCAKQGSVEEVARATLDVLLRTVPAAVPSINFLSGGQSPELSTAHLNAMNKMEPNLPWNLSFSYGRALQAPSIEAWKGKTENVAAAQAQLKKRCALNSAACLGEYLASQE